MTGLVRRVLAGSAGAAVLVCVLAAPAAAHTLTGVAPTNYRTEVTAITPATAGLSLRLVDLGRQVELRNDSATTFVVLGYYGEPYLRVGPDGGFENANAPSTYTNRNPAESSPPGVTATSPVSWRRIGAEHVVRWRDQRVRAEGADPPEVRSAPGVSRVVRNWQLTLRAGESPASPSVFVLGRITYVPPPAAAPWLVLVGVIGVAMFLGTLGRRRSAWLVAGVAALVAIDTVNAAAGVAFSTTGIGSIARTLLTRDVLTSVAWLAGLASLVGLRRGHAQALVLAGATAWIVTVTSGLSDRAVFTRAVLPSKLDPDITRLYTALTLGIGLGLSAACARLLVERGRLRRAR